MYLRTQDSKLLELDTTWLVVASVPLIVAVLRSNVVESFTGFGFELKTRLRDPVGEISLVATAADAATILPQREKESIQKLQSLDLAERRAIRRLTLIQGRVAYYDVDALAQYLYGLPDLRFLEVQDEEGYFVALLPVSTFRAHGSIDTNQLRTLIIAIENRSVREVFRASAVSETVSADESLLAVLPKIRESKFGYLPMTSSSDRLLGIITTEIVEKRIADAVIAAQSSTRQLPN
jgi:CBS domain-containing protein